jgi:hypothetical protein
MATELETGSAARAVHDASWAPMLVAAQQVRVAAAAMVGWPQPAP